MSDFIFEPNTTTQQKQENEYFTIDGQQDYFDSNGYPRSKNTDSYNVMAKKIFRIDGSTKYMIRVAYDGKMYNPMSIYENSKNSAKSKSLIKFREVSYKSFDMYLSFLKTKNLSWLYNSEREAE